MKNKFVFWKRVRETSVIWWVFIEALFFQLDQVIQKLENP